MTVRRGCTYLCARMPRCGVCHRTKAPHGRSVPPAAAGSYCDADCRGYHHEPDVGHLWPEEWRAHAAGDHSACDDCSGDVERSASTVPETHCDLCGTACFGDDIAPPCADCGQLGWCAECRNDHVCPAAPEPAP